MAKAATALVDELRAQSEAVEAELLSVLSASQEKILNRLLLKVRRGFVERA